MPNSSPTHYTQTFKRDIGMGLIHREVKRYRRKPPPVTLVKTTNTIKDSHDPTCGCCACCWPDYTSKDIDSSEEERITAEHPQFSRQISVLIDARRDRRRKQQRKQGLDTSAKSDEENQTTSYYGSDSKEQQSASCRTEGSTGHAHEVVTTDRGGALEKESDQDSSTSSSESYTYTSTT